MTLYPDMDTFSGRMDDLIPQLLSVVVPHVEALQAEGTTLAQAMGERLRRALVRMEPLLDEALSELKDFRTAQNAMHRADADLRDSLLRAQDLLTRERLIAHGVRLSDILVSRPWLRRMERWEELLRFRCPQPTGTATADRMLGALEGFLDGLRDRERAESVLADVHGLLRVALAQMADVGHACERMFPDVAQRVQPRPVPVQSAPEEAGRFDIH